MSTELTKEAYERLSSELEDLTTRGRIEISRQIEAARALGDLSENGDYHAAKDAQGKMEARIRQIQTILKNCTIVDENLTNSDTVSIGSVILLRFDGDDEVEKYMVGSIEEKREGVTIVSPSSPLGRALIGKKVGNRVEYEAPNGMLYVEIVEIL